MSAITIKDLKKYYGDIKAVDGVSLEVEEKEIFGILGPNGAGKTTTMEMVETLREPDSGEITVMGMSARKDARAVKQIIGVQLQTTVFFDTLTVWETIDLFGAFYPRTLAVDELVALAELQEKADARVNELSGGQHKRLSIALALVNDPSIVFLDEPTTGLDPQARRQLWELIEHFKTAGRTIILTTHYMDEAERLCDRVAIMDHGRIIALGTPRELVGSMGVDHVVEFSIGGGAPDLTALGRLDGVRLAHSDDGVYQLQVTQLHVAVPALLAELARCSIPLTELRTHSATLEDVFVSLTGRHLRDDN